MTILIIGNGSIGNYQNKKFYINNHTGKFLKEIGNKHQVLYIDNMVKYMPNNFLQNFELKANNIAFFGINKGIKKSKNPIVLLKIISLILNHDYIYLFFPGTLSRFIAIFCIIFQKKYGLYIRGQFYNHFLFDKIILRNTKFILTISPLFQSALNAYCKEVNIIKPMISIQEEDIDFSRKYEKPDKWNLLFVGRIEYRKGIHELIEIAQYLKSKHLNFEMNLVGGGDLFYATQEQVKNKNLAGYVKLHGQISDKQSLMNLYSKADVFVFTSHDEGFPRVLYEAMAKGLPIFTTFVGGIPGLMVDNENCIKLPLKKGFNAGKTIYDNLNNIEILKRIGLKGQNSLKIIIEGNYSSHELLVLEKFKNQLNTIL